MDQLPASYYTFRKGAVHLRQILRLCLGQNSSREGRGQAKVRTKTMTASPVNESRAAPQPKLCALKSGQLSRMEPGTSHTPNREVVCLLQDGGRKGLEMEAGGSLRMDQMGSLR